MESSELGPLFFPGNRQRIAPIELQHSLLPWSPLGGGWLSGKYKRNQMPTGATRLGENPKRGMEAFDKRNSDATTWEIIGAVEEIAAARGATMAQVAIAWVAAQPAVTSVILGARTTDQLRDNLGASELTLTAEEVATLSAVSKPRMSDYPYGEGGVKQRNRNLSGGR